MQEEENVHLLAAEIPSYWLEAAKMYQLSFKHDFLQSFYLPEILIQARGHTTGAGKNTNPYSANL